MANTTKDTIYIDIDDEITSIIDKVRSSDKKIIALVLPKRAAVLQSTVNMRLLKKTADDDKKNIVLITSEAGLLPLAGVVGVHVAKTLQSKPAIPSKPVMKNAPITVNESADMAEGELDVTKPIGELAGEEEAIEVDNVEDTTLAAAGAAAEKPVKKSGKKKISIPNFNKFRVRLILGVLALILVIVGWYMAFYVLPKANVLVKTDTTTVDTTFTFTASPEATELDEEQLIIPAKSTEIRKTENEKTAATGEKDIGEKATGQVTLQNCSASTDEVTIPAGTGVSNNNLTFITTEAVTLPQTSFNGLLQCNTDTEDVSVVAQNAGDKYNISGDRSFTVAGYSKVAGIDSTPMTGGTTKIVKVVTQQDIDTAKQKLADRGAETVKDELKGDLEQEGYFGLEVTVSAGTPAVTSSPNVGEEAAEVTVTATTTYTMLGVNEDDLKKLIEEAIKDKIDPSKQVILDNGLENANITIIEKKANGEARISLGTSVLAGPQLDVDTIKREVAGKKRGEAVGIVQQRPGIKEVTIDYSPFWVYSTPKNTDKINVVFEQNNTDVTDTE